MTKDIRFLITDYCNYKCYFCHNEGRKNACKFMALTVAQYVLLFEIYYEMTGWNGVTLSGGEPLMHPQFDALVRLLSAAGAKITVVTNGSLIDWHLASMQHVDRVNISIHTTDIEAYGKITGRRDLFTRVIQSMKRLRFAYPEISMRLNVTPCRNIGWSGQQFQQLVHLAISLGASIKCTELFPNTNDDCVALDQLVVQLYKMDFQRTPQGSHHRGVMYTNDNDVRVYLERCTCSQAIMQDAPADYCCATRDLYVNCDGTFSLCMLSDEKVDFWEEIVDNNIEKLKEKMRLALDGVPEERCLKYLKSI